MSALPNDIKYAPSFPVTIHIAGDYETAREECQRFCDIHGLCVTVTPTEYIYTGGSEAGVRVGLINYPRFPKMGTEIALQAIELAYALRAALGQQSFSVETPENTTWFSWRERDVV
ncbi:hypothetical protein [Agrobacterium sp. CFBP2214]|uniref:hypothetical protein n=1 Tax=Agrobacterium sp. CFBP2214 TaxID=3040274 RepID=UPI000DCFCD82|nr:hypothetical protein [Agrobacterium sp. CFBP2214]